MNYTFRNGDDRNSWCNLLLPFCLLSCALHSDALWLNFMICLVLSISCFLKQNLSNSKRYQSFSPNIISGVLSLLASVVAWYYTTYNIFACYLLCFGSLFLFNYLISRFLQSCPGSFTLGEAQVIGQGIILFLLCYLEFFINEWKLSVLVSKTKYSASIHFSEVLLLGCLLLVYSIYIIPSLRYGVNFHLTCATVALLMLSEWTICHKKNPVLWLLKFCLYNKIRISILIFWVINTFVSIVFVAWFNQTSKSKATTVTRKYFHFIITAVYIPGIIYDVELLILASTVALSVFIILEIYRILNVPIIGPIIGNAFQVFLDEKDSGILILTHIYLLVGCSCPVWLYTYHLKEKDYHICLMSGILSVGFGDSAAALFGSSFGRHYWNGSKKTIEGTVCAFLTQLMCSFIFLYIGHHYSTYNCLLVIMSAFFTSLLEAKTTQIDNLVLPLFTFSFLSWIQ